MIYVLYLPVVADDDQVDFFSSMRCSCCFVLFSRLMSQEFSSTVDVVCCVSSLGRARAAHHL